MTTAEEQIETLALFDDSVRLYEERPERIKAIIPKFVNFVVWHPANEETGEGRVDVSLFGLPFLGEGDSPMAWEEALAELDRHCQENANRSVGQNAAGSRESLVGVPYVTPEGTSSRAWKVLWFTHLRLCSSSSSTTGSTGTSSVRARNNSVAVASRPRGTSANMKCSRNGSSVHQSWSLKNTSGRWKPWVAVASGISPDGQVRTTQSWPDT